MFGRKPSSDFTCASSFPDICLLCVTVSFHTVTDHLHLQPKQCFFYFILAGLKWNQLGEMVLAASPEIQHFPLPVLV